MKPIFLLSLMALSASSITGCHVETQSADTIIDVQVPEGKLDAVDSIVRGFARQKKLALAVTHRPQDFGSSSTYELENKHVLLIVNNPFERNRFSVFSYSLVSGDRRSGVVAAQELARRLSSP